MGSGPRRDRARRQRQQQSRPAREYVDPHQRRHRRRHPHRRRRYRRRWDEWRQGRAPPRSRPDPRRVRGQRRSAGFRDDAFPGPDADRQNDDWAGGFDFSSVGAFAFASPTRDAAIYNSAAPSGSFSIQITGKNNATGVALAEVHDATPTTAFTASTPRLVNVAARTQVGTGDNILIAGFVVGGSTPVRVLVRAVGPTLGVFGVGGVLTDPRLIITSEGRTVAENDNWPANDAGIFPTVGAFDLTANSRDAALVVTLQPGNYTAQVSGVNNTTGVALVEVYEVP